MVDALTYHDTLALQDVVGIDDLLILPFVRIPNLSEALALQKAGVISVESSLIARNTLWRGQIGTEEAYCRSRRRDGREPAWVEDLPMRLRAWLRHTYVTTQEDPLVIVGPIPFTGVSYMVLEGGLCEDLMHTFGLFRLSRVKQLGFLQAPWVNILDRPLVTPLSNGTRYAHSHDVSAIASLIGRNVGLKGGEFNTLRAAGLVHDWGTPAGGDSVKLIDTPAFDEDLNFERLLRTRITSEQWKDLARSYGLRKKLLVQTVLNKGLLGQILDIADKIAYVARDIRTCLTVGVLPQDEDAYVGTRALEELVAENPYICNIWDSVTTSDGQLVFTDPRRLVAFLKARIVLFRELYYHPRARFGEYLISRILVKRLYDRGELTRDELLEMGDSELERKLNDAYGEPNITRVLSTTSKVRSFATREEALEFKRELQTVGVQFILLEDHRFAIKPGTNLLVKTGAGPRRLLEAYRGDAQELHEMANMLPAVHVYYIENPGTDELLSALLERDHLFTSP